jgi:hypothetical protein
MVNPFKGNRPDTYSKPLPVLGWSGSSYITCPVSRQVFDYGVLLSPVRISTRTSSRPDFLLYCPPRSKMNVLWFKLAYVQ